MENSRNPKKGPEQAPEQAMDGLLSHSLREAADPAGQVCPDAEILAAYYERSLPRSETARWEAHFATCGRCQAQLATLVRSYDVTGLEAGAPDQAASLAWLWNWRWVAPAATAAVVVLALWVVDPASLVNRSPSLETEFREADQATPAASASAAEEQKQDAAVAPAEQELATPRQALEKAERDALEPETPGRRAQLAKEPASAADIGRGTDEQEAQAKLASKAAVRALTEQPAGAAERTAERADDQLPESPALVDSFRANRAREVSEDRAKVGAVSGVLVERTAGTRIASPIPSILWRFAASGRIEYSSDEGTTWSVQADLGVELLTGSAPSELVCWVVGRAGFVARTTDGERWERATTPTADDLVGVEAQDAMNATVVTAGGNRYVTADGGRSWALAVGR